MITGRSKRCLINFRASRPSMPGIQMSRRIRLISFSSSSCNPSSAEAAASGMKPSSVRMPESASRMAASSSMIRIVLDIGARVGQTGEKDDAARRDDVRLGEFFIFIISAIQR